MVDKLGRCVDELAGESQSLFVRQRLNEAFRRVGLWEHAFWDMCWRQQDWRELTGERS